MKQKINDAKETGKAFAGLVICIYALIGLGFLVTVEEVIKWIFGKEERSFWKEK